MYITKKEEKILADMFWEMSESGKFDKDHSRFLDNNKIDIKDIEDLKIKLIYAKYKEVYNK